MSIFSYRHIICNNLFYNRLRIQSDFPAQQVYIAVFYIIIRNSDAPDTYIQLCSRYIVKYLFSKSAGQYIFFNRHKKSVILCKSFQHLCIQRLYKSGIDQ